MPEVNGEGQCLVSSGSEILELIKCQFGIIDYIHCTVSLAQIDGNDIDGNCFGITLSTEIWLHLSLPENMF